MSTSLLLRSLPEDVGWAVPTNAKTERPRDGETEGKTENLVSPSLLPSVSPSSSPPLLRDCSPESCDVPKTDHHIQPSAAAPPLAAETSVLLPPQAAAARMAFFAPAQPISDVADESPVTELKITP